MVDAFWLKVVFWWSGLTLVYIYVGYPLLVWTLGRLWPKRVRKGPVRKDVSVVVVAYNEAHNLERKIRSVLASDGAEQVREVVVASDGSTDHTAEVVRAVSDRRVRLVEFPHRRGKPAVLNDVVPTCRGEIVVLTDARQELSRPALAALLENFADPTVGVVSGELVFRSDEDTTTVSSGVGAYWRYEKFIRKCESRFRSVPGATGALYAIRKSLFRPLPENTILDDVVLPLQIVEQGYRCVFEPRAVVWDRPSRSPRQEAVRKRRTIAGAAQLVVNHPRWLLPWKNPIWFEYVSHKLLRLLSPVLLVLVAAANWPLRHEPLYAVTYSLQLGLYLAALIGWAFQRLGQKAVLFAPPLLFVTLNSVTLAALWDALRGRFRPTWRKASG